ncbi:MAG: sigma factor [Planctomycetota bacterium]
MGPFLPAICAHSLGLFARHMGLSEQDADSVVQETMIAAITTFREPRFDPAKGSLKSFMRCIANHKVIDKQCVRAPGRRESGREEFLYRSDALQKGDRNDFLSTMGRLYMRESQLPQGKQFRTKPQLLLEMVRLCAEAVEGPYLAAFEGGYAIRTVVRPLASPPEGQPQIQFLTRLRRDARLYGEPPERNPGKVGRPRKWGERLPVPQNAENWPGKWRQTEAHMYGNKRSVRFKKVLCQWRPAGAEARVHAFAFEVEGYQKPWYLVTSDLGLSARQVPEIYAARFAQENAHRQLKQ